ncbi:DUF411 domain-containing protein [Pyruvatibacter mobilis]|uniref:DUF411 domain-containing protein n=1 Tax=Pyruvatibacter mobilis TaxID=1712261 RepID=UPI003BA9F8A2
MKRRTVLALITAGVLVVTGGVAFLGFQPSARAAEITVYKDPNCGCCGQWVNHVKAAGFAVTVKNTPELGRIKTELGVPADLHSCHTATVDGYVIEGHVPAADIRRLLVERPDARGIAVPGMPIGSPGMEQGSRREPYRVILFENNGNRSTFARH